MMFGPLAHTSPLANGSVTTSPVGPTMRTSVNSGVLPADPSLARPNSGVRKVSIGAVSVRP